MPADDLHEKIEKVIVDTVNRYIAIYIASLVALLALCAMGGNDVDKTAMAAHIEASNTWAFFQAKNIRQLSSSLAADELEILKASNPDLPEAALALIDKKIKTNRDRAARYQSEPETGDGKKELIAKAKKLEKIRNRALRQEPYFDFAEALFQIAIVLASISLIAGRNALIFTSLISASVASFLMYNGYTLTWLLPYLG